MSKKSREQIIQEDKRDLHRLGYAQQLFREMGGFSNFAISFSIISILTGAILLFGFGLRFAGPIVNSVGWPLVSLFVLAIAASMAELASAYPTAGGLYFWAYRLGGRRWAWATAWFNMIGQVTTPPASISEWRFISLARSPESSTSPQGRTFHFLGRWTIGIFTCS
jgi:amino acid transporter